MPNRCCVEGCKNSYSVYSEKCSVFHFPKKLEKANVWLQNISRKDYNITKSSVVCENHFEEKFIVREDKATRPDGTILTIKRKIPKLTVDAVPTIFDQNPDTKKFKKEDSIQNFKEYEVNMQMQKLTEDEDFILNLQDLVMKYKDKLNGYINVIDVKIGEVFTIYKIDMESRVPSLIYSIKIYENLKCHICYKTFVLQDEDINKILSSKLVCNRWSKLRDILNHLETLERSQSNYLTEETYIKNSIEYLDLFFK
ncbi:hypothetical protein ILUMI_21273 [Ignelater luminosus]|uniref:THAP-type domain-containing protein n=1 Tax=Ignelater luminosus TaxID=2038154 RepID=A0A8K0CJ51_IGNLU|nr:hypothetical protein ILUMI_21273 [Ignelater luminosus]